MPKPTSTEEYLFDLRGYTVVTGALDDKHVAEINGWTDELPALEAGQWHEGMEVHTYRGADGMNLQNVCEGGAMFERMIDHPSWIDLVRHYLGANAPFIHEMFLNVRSKGATSASTAEAPSWTAASRGESSTASGACST